MNLRYGDTRRLAMFYKEPKKLHGKLNRDGKLVKTGKQVVLFKIYDGFGLPIEVLSSIKSVEIHYKGVIYTATPSMFYEHGIANRYQDESQLILPRKYFGTNNQTELNLNQYVQNKDITRRQSVQ
jgi:hypothetical protein